MSKIAGLLLVVCVMSLVAMGQTSKGFIVGNIADPNTAALSGATVKITNTQTGTSRETVTQADGSYRLDAVDPGTYTLEVSASGFKTTNRENVVVSSAQTAEVSVQLEVGNANETVTVSSGEGLIELQSQDGTRVNTLDTRQITDLPVAGLNPVNLVFTLPGVVEAGPLSGGFVQGTEFSVNGLRPRANNQLLDGTDNNDNSITGQAYQPVLRDGFQEVTVLSSDYSAEFGRAGGAVVNVITRSGTNDFHGSIYDVISSSALSSLSPGEKVNQELTKKPVSIENDYGFSIGGPILKNKLFFFGTFQNSPFRSGTIATGVVPTAAGFAQLRALFPAGTSANLDNYLSIVGDVRGTTNLRIVPLGNGRPSIQFGTASVASSQPVDDKQYLARIDYSPNSRDSFGFRYLADKQLFGNQFPTIFRGFEVDVPSLVQNFYSNYTHNFSPNTTNEFRFSYARTNVLFGNRNPAALNSPLVTISANSISPFGLDSGFPQGRIFNNYQFQDTVTRTIGDHTIRAGVDMVKQLAKQFVPFNSRGSLTFTSGGTYPIPGSDTPGTYGAFANFIEGFSGSQGTFGGRSFGSPVIYPNSLQQAYFINDNWRATQSLTLNFGLRYENYGTPFNVATFPAFAGFNAPLTTVVKQKSDNNNFAPRFSFAYQPHFGKKFFGEEKTVIRGGFAVNYDVFFNNILANTAASSPNVVGSSTSGSTVGGRGFANAGPNFLPIGATADTTTAISSIDPNLRNPRTFVYNFGVQRELPFKLVADVAYVGSRGTGLFINEDINPGIGLDADRNLISRSVPNFGQVQLRTNGGDSSYNSLQARLERGFSKGLLFRLAYTFSKAIDDVNSEVFVTSGGSSRGSQPFDRRADRSVAGFDVPHRFVVSFLYDIPSPSENRFVKAAFGGFTLSGIYRIQSGAVETPYVGGIDLNGDANAFNDRPAISNPNAPANSVGFSNEINGTASPTGYSDFNGNDISPSAVRYIVDYDIRTGLAGRNTLRAERINSLDLSLDRAIHLPLTPENHRLKIRVDFFNVLNHPTFTFDGAVSDGDVLNQNFNNVRLNDGTSRSGRIQVRYEF
jgi:hypothetical protein